VPQLRPVYALWMISKYDMDTSCQDNINEWRTREALLYYMPTVIWHRCLCNRCTSTYSIWPPSISAGVVQVPSGYWYEDQHAGTQPYVPGRHQVGPTACSAKKFMTTTIRRTHTLHMHSLCLRKQEALDIVDQESVRQLPWYCQGMDSTFCMVQWVQYFCIW